MKVKKITFAQFLQLEGAEYELYKRIGLSMKPDAWQVSDVLDWDFITVKKVQGIILQTYDYQTFIQVVQMLTGWIAEKILLKIWFDVFAFHNFVTDQIDRVNELEEKLIYEPSADEEKTGIEQFSQFGYFATVDRLAGGDVTKYDTVGAVDYATIYTKLLLNRIDGEYHERLIEIKTKR